MHTNSDTLLEPLLLQKNTPSRLFHASRCKIKHILAPLTSVGLIVSARRYREPKQSSARRAAGWGTVFLHRTSVPCSRCSSWQSSRSCTWCAQAIANTPGFSFPTHVQSAPELKERVVSAFSSDLGSKRVYFGCLLRSHHGFSMCGTTQAL